MSERLYRTQILLEPEQHRALSEIAHTRDQSISHVIREIVDLYLAGQDEAVQKQQKAFDKIEKHRAEILARNGGKPLDIDITAIIEEMRQERADEQLADILRRD
jgi:hypothetical protein